MAAIAGIIGRENGGELVSSMLDAIKHRGPDVRNVGGGGTACMGVQASRISAARGNGFAATGDVTLLLDGELHNSRGAGESDAEAALNLYRRFGRAFASRLDGAFACAVLDGEELILARDSLGIRPLYFGTASGGGFCFASEMKAFAGRAGDVEEVLPGTSYSTTSGVSGYVPLLPPVAIPKNFEEAAVGLRNCVMRAVERRLADGAVGACLLSGGLDSSIIAAAVKALGGDVPLVTVGCEGCAPDVENAKSVAAHLGMKHEVRIFAAKDIEELVPRAVWCMESFDEDCISGTLSNLVASGLARSFTNCILSGEGADEFFGGYHLLKELPGGYERLEMMKRLAAIAYNTALQRLDRSMMANSVTYRTPFLDAEVVSFAAHLPVEWKIRRCAGDEQVEKWILREAFRDMLPESIYRRVKLRFSMGTGTDGIMEQLAGSHVAPDEFNDRTRATPEGYVLNSPKELWYYRLFKERFPDPCFERLVGRWDPSK